MMGQDDKDLERTLNLAKEEILSLRKDNKELRLRLSGFEDALKLLNAREPSVCYGQKEDEVSMIDRELEKLFTSGTAEGLRL